MASHVNHLAGGGPKRQRRADIAVIGGGVTGLFLAVKLTAQRLSVVVVEKADCLAGGASTRNEGWLHAGTYHAASIQVPDAAVEVARRCRHGHEQIRHYAPEALEEPLQPSFALIKAPERVADVLARWGRAGVAYRRVPFARLRRAEPQVAATAPALVCEVADTSLHTRLLYTKLAGQARRQGACLLTAAEVTAIEGDVARLHLAGRQELTVRARAFVYAAGPGLLDLVDTHLGVRLPLRFWKSHLLLLPRAAGHGLFYVDPGEAAVMHHGAFSVAGLNEDAVRVARATYDPLPAGVARVRRALGRLLPRADLSRAVGTACVKVDVEPDEAGPRSLRPAYGELRPNHFWVVPGKMTEAPVVADQLTQVLFERLYGGAGWVALRPCDLLARSGRRPAPGRVAPVSG